MPLCGSNQGCGCAIGSVPAEGGELDGFLPSINVDGNGLPASPWNLTLNDEWADAVVEHLTDLAKGWQPIDAGTESDLTVNVPAGLSRVRVFWSGSASGTANMQMRINNDATAALHVRSLSTVTPAGVFTAIDGVAGTFWYVGLFEGVLKTWGSFEVDLLDGFCPMQGIAARQGIPAGSARFDAWGILAAARVVTSLELSISTGAFVNLDWRAEGYYE